MITVSLILLISTYITSSDTMDVPPPPTSHSSAYQEAAKILTKTLNVSRNSCDSFYEYACERYDGKYLVLGDAQKQVFDAVYKEIKSSRGTPKPWKKYEQYVDACVASKRNYSSVLDPKLVVALVRNFTEETGLRFPLLDGRPVIEWPNATTLGRVLGYLERTSVDLNPLFQTDVSSNVIDPKSAQPYYLFIGNVVPYPDFRKTHVDVHKVELDVTEELLEKYANLVGRYIPRDELATEMKAIERFGAVIKN